MKVVKPLAHILSTLFSILICLVSVAPKSVAAEDVFDATLDDGFGVDDSNLDRPSTPAGSQQKPPAANASNMFDEGDEGFGAPIEDFPAEETKQEDLGLLEEPKAEKPTPAVKPAAPAPTPRSASPAPVSQVPAVVSQPAAPAVPIAAVSTPMPTPIPAPQTIPAPPPPAVAQAPQVPVVDPAPTAPTLPQPNEFAGAPPIPGTRRLMAEGEAPEEYLVEPGDTLFDVCDQLIDEPNYWPKLWALNPDIKNPHFIFPGMRLRFYPGDANTPPFLQVVAEDDVMPVDKGQLRETDLIAQPLAQLQQSSIDLFQSEDTFQIVNSSEIEVSQDILDGFIVAGNIYRSPNIQLTVPGFIFSQQREGLGLIVGERAGGHMASEAHDAIIEVADALAVGSTYSVIRPGGQIENPETGTRVGYRYDFVGNIRVTRNTNADFAIAKVIDSRLPLRPEDLVVPFISTIRVIPVEEGAASTADSTVIGFGSADQIVGAEGGYVFLDKTTAAGLAAGQYLQIYQHPAHSHSALVEKIPEESEPVAVLRIIDTTDAAAVGYVVRGSREIRIGARAAAKG